MLMLPKKFRVQGNESFCESLGDAGGSVKILNLQGITKALIIILSPLAMDHFLDL